MKRIRAAAIHLLVSVSIAASLFFAFWFVWYPYPLFHAVGGLDIFLILLAVDVTLGPLLTFVVFDTNKRTLKFDLSVIALFQLAALLYGVYTLYIGRPVYAAALGHRFDLVQATSTKKRSRKVRKGTFLFSGRTLSAQKHLTTKSYVKT
jgi:hypothetical protein